MPRRASLILRGAVAGALALAALAAPAGAQDDCILDRCGRPRDAARDTPRPSDNPRPSALAPGDFDFYVLALSWSPGFCAATGDRDRQQCAPGRRLGFVVHGLWPQRANGPSPQDCDIRRAPARADVESVRDLFPSDGLARYEWRKHGSCTGLAPSAYFADVRRARESLRIPEMPINGAGRADPQRILRAFSDANPRLLAGMAAISCPRNLFQEIRICMSKDLRGFVACPDVARRSCRARDIEAPAPL